MKRLYFSGFCLDNEKELFKEYLEESDFTISGFSYGAIKALNKVKSLITQGKRVDKLQLISPAFFNDKDEKYKRLQMIFFQKDNDLYCKNFLKNCGFDQQLWKKYFSKGTSEELEELLYFKWKNEDLQYLVDKGVLIEVFVGMDDKIINSNSAVVFFKQFADIYSIKNKGHIL